jgi:hypothetical protein
MSFHPRTLSFGKHRLLWNINDQPQVVSERFTEPRPLYPAERKLKFSKSDIWLRLDVGFGMLATYLFLQAPVSLGDVLNAMTTFFQSKLTSSEKEVYKRSHAFEYGRLPKIDFARMMRNATHGDLRGNSVYLEGFHVERNGALVVPFFGS